MVEVYRVTRRVELGVKATAVCSEKLQQLLKDISRVWNNLTSFMSLAKLVVRHADIALHTCTLQFSDGFHDLTSNVEMQIGIGIHHVVAFRLRPV